MTRRLFVPSEPGCFGVAEQLDSFLAGTALIDLKELCEISVAMSLTPTAEAAAERPHAVMKHELHFAPSSSVSHLSCNLRLPDWRRDLEADPSLLKDVVLSLGASYHPVNAAKELSLAAHPALSDIMQDTLVLGEDGAKELLGSTHKHAVTL